MGLLFMFEYNPNSSLDWLTFTSRPGRSYLIGGYLHICCSFLCKLSIHASRVRSNNAAVCTIDCFHTNVEVNCLPDGRVLDVLGGPRLATVTFQVMDLDFNE